MTPALWETEWDSDKHTCWESANLGGLDFSSGRATNEPWTCARPFTHLWPLYSQLCNVSKGLRKSLAPSRFIWCRGFIKREKHFLKKERKKNSVRHWSRQFAYPKPLEISIFITTSDEWTGSRRRWTSSSSHSVQPPQCLCSFPRSTPQYGNEWTSLLSNLQSS